MRNYSPDLFEMFVDHVRCMRMPAGIPMGVDFEIEILRTGAYEFVSQIDQKNSIPMAPVFNKCIFLRQWILMRGIFIFRRDAYDNELTVDVTG